MRYFGNVTVSFISGLYSYGIHIPYVIYSVGLAATGVGKPGEHDLFFSMPQAMYMYAIHICTVVDLYLIYSGHNIRKHYFWTPGTASVPQSRRLLSNKLMLLY
jgi:hypothetical protein